METGSEPITEPGLRERLARQGRIVYVKAFAFAALVTALAIAI
jgi:hypothetical protein